MLGLKSMLRLKSMLGLTNSWVSMLILLISGAISVFAFAPFDHPAMMVLSILALLFVIENQTLGNRKLIIYAYIYALAYFNTQLYWIFSSLYYVMKTGFWVALIAHIGFMWFLATYIVFAIFFYVRIRTKYNWFNYLVLFPSLWVFFEWFRGYFLGGFAWCEVGYSQVANSFFRGIYPLIGSYAVSWITLSLIGVAYLILNPVDGLKVANRGFKLSLLYVAALLSIGQLLDGVQYTHNYGKPITVGLIQGNISEADKWSHDPYLEVYPNLIANTKADLVLIPETAIAGFEEDLPQGFLDKLTKIANDNHSELVIGIPKIINDEDDYVNAALLLTNSNHPYYAKYHLVPYGEYIPLKEILKPVYAKIRLPMVGFTKGAEQQKPIVAASQKLAFNICYENAFGAELIWAAKQSTLMVNLSDMVWYGYSIAKDEHVQMSQIRALENQRYFIQETNTGITAIINPQGQIVDTLPIFKRLVLKATVQGRYGVTPFEDYGNYLIVIFCLIMIIGAFACKVFYIKQQKLNS